MWIVSALCVLSIWTLPEVNRRLYSMLIVFQSWHPVLVSVLTTQALEEFCPHNDLQLEFWILWCSKLLWQRKNKWISIKEKVSFRTGAANNKRLPATNRTDPGVRPWRYSLGGSFRVGLEAVAPTASDQTQSGRWGSKCELSRGKHKERSFNASFQTPTGESEELETWGKWSRHRQQNAKSQKC